MAGVKSKKKVEDTTQAQNKQDKKRKTPETDTNPERFRKSSREKKAVNYSEEALVEVSEKAKPGSYAAPHDPPGMKSTAYMCKHPAAPAPVAEVYDERMPLPKRNKEGEWVFADFPDFRPNLSPAEVLKDGAFGGTYFRPIKSAVTGEQYENQHLEFPEDWIKGIPTKHLTSKTYHAHINKWNVECGGALDMWYCRFYLGRRSSDDKRQISRMNGVAGPKGRFRNQLLNKIVLARTAHDDPNISPVIRQTLHHWAYEITAKDLAKHK